MASTEAHAVKLQVYKSEGVYRNNRKRGGYRSYVKAGIFDEVLSKLSSATVHSESITTKCAGVFVASIYRPMSGDVKDYVDYISTILQYAYLLGPEILVAGEFSIDILTPNTQSQQRLDEIESFSCPSVIRLPTIITP